MDNLLRAKPTENCEPQGTDVQGQSTLQSTFQCQEEALHLIFLQFISKHS